MRPVDGNALADRAAELGVDRHAQHLATDVEQRVLDRRDGLVIEAAAGRTGEDMQASHDGFAAKQILADHQGRERTDHVGKARRNSS